MTMYACPSQHNSDLSNNAFSAIPNCLYSRQYAANTLKAYVIPTKSGSRCPCMVKMCLGTHHLITCASTNLHF